MTRVFDLVALNLFFVLMCIPIFTIGANVTAMYYVTLKMVRDEDCYIFRSYLKSFKENFKQSTILWCFFLLFGLLLYCDIRYFSTFTTSSLYYLKYVAYFLCLVYCIVLLFAFPLQSKFANPVKRTLLNALLLSIKHLPYTVIMLAITFLPAYLCIKTSATLFAMYALLLPLCGFTTTAYLHSIFLDKVFNHYI